MYLIRYELGIPQTTDETRTFWMGGRMNAGNNI